MGNKKYLLSIIVIVYNNEEYIESCLKDLLDSLCSDIQLIIVDDGSNDKSSLIINKLIDKIDNVQLIKKNNGGISSARNEGLRHANGKYVAFIDGDDWINIKGLLNNLKKIVLENADVYLLNTTKYYENNKLYEVENFDFNSGYININNLINNKIFGRAWRFIVKRQYLINHSINFIEGLIYEDEEYIPKIISYTDKIYYLNFPYYYYRKGVESTTSSKTFNKIKNLMKIVVYSYDWFQTEKRNKKYVFWSLSRCIRNIFSFECNNEEKKYINEWYLLNKNKILNIISIRKTLYFCFIICGPYKGVKLYKKYFRKRYKTIKVLSESGDVY